MVYRFLGGAYITRSIVAADASLRRALKNTVDVTTITFKSFVHTFQWEAGIKMIKLCLSLRGIWPGRQGDHKDGCE